MAFCPFSEDTKIIQHPNWKNNRIIKLILFHSDKRYITELPLFVAGIITLAMMIIVYEKILVVFSMLGTWLDDGEDSE